MELSKDRIENAKSHQIKIVDWDELPNYKFDYINTEQVIEHLADPIETIEYLMQSLKPGGLFKISVPNGSTAERNLKLLDWNQPRDSEYSLHVVTPLEHINVFMVESIIKMADKCGLDPIYTVRNVSFDHTISWKQFIKHKLGPVYRKIKKPKFEDSSIFFVKR
jgi:SAM-dependent methyltransferase